MIYEVTINTKNKCYGCKLLKLDKPTDWYGHCESLNPRIKERYRYVLDKACSWKNYK